MSQHEIVTLIVINKTVPFDEKNERRDPRVRVTLFLPVNDTLYEILKDQS